MKRAATRKDRNWELGARDVFRSVRGSTIFQWSLVGTTTSPSPSAALGDGEVVVPTNDHWKIVLPRTLRNTSLAPSSQFLSFLVAARFMPTRQRPGCHASPRVIPRQRFLESSSAAA